MGITLNPELEDRIAAKVRDGFYRSAEEVVEAGLDLLEAGERVVAETRNGSGGQDSRPVWEIAAAIVKEMPAEAWDEVPTDLARNHKHYLYSAPREDEKRFE